MKVAVARAICSGINRRLIGKGQFNSFSSEVKLTRCRLHSRSSRLESRSTMGLRKFVTACRCTFNFAQHDSFVGELSQRAARPNAYGAPALSVFILFSKK